MAGDLAALLSGYYRVDLQTNPAGIPDSINENTDVLLLVNDNDQPDPLQPLDLTNAVIREDCKVILLGPWQESLWADCGYRVIFLREMPSPSRLLKAISFN